MLERGKKERGIVELVDTESLVPQDHLLRKVDGAIDFGKLYRIVEPLYSEDEGRPSIDPVVLFKIVLLQHLDGILVMRTSMPENKINSEFSFIWVYSRARFP